MIDPTVTDFFTKNAENDYLAEYDRSHGPRLDALIKHFGFEDLKNKRILDVGGGLGFLGKRLNPENEYLVIDGADVSMENRVCPNMSFRQFDLDHDNFGDKCLELGETQFDIGFFLETIEHIGNPHHALVEIKKLVKTGSLILISIPTITVWHNTPYPSLLWSTENFKFFLGQMALPIIEAWDYNPVSIGWPAHHFLCRNDTWDKKQLLFPKNEEKFKFCTPLQATNL